MPWETSIIKFSYEVFFCFCTVLEMELPRTWHLTLESEHPPRTLHCQSICSYFENFAVVQHHQYHLEPVVPLNRSPVKSLPFGVVLIALGDSRGYSYRRLALLLGLFCSPLPALAAHRFLDL